MESMEGKKMIYALVVVYNKKCQESETLKSVLPWKEHLQIVVFDNSTKDFQNKNYCEGESIQYLTHNKNLGLSKAYNRAISALQLKESDYIIILDDDTELSEEYIKSVLDDTQLGIDILLPRVYSNQTLISPTNLKYNCASKIVSCVEELDMNQISAINSGMVIRGSVFGKIRYNEKLFLDYVDHDFMKKARMLRSSFKVLDSNIVQHFSRDEKPKLESALFRFELFKKDFRVYCFECEVKWYYYLFMCKYIMQCSIKYRTLKFVKSFIKR